MEIIHGYENWTELDLLAGLIIGEARGESTSGKIGVALTVRTRALHPRWWGRNYREVILCYKPATKPGRPDIAQFSCWLDHNVSAIVAAHENKDFIWKSALTVAEDVYTGNVLDFIGGPTHYHALTVYPDWASGMKRLATVGNHVFYRDTREIR